MNDNIGGIGTEVSNNAAFTWGFWGANKKQIKILE
jgi:hypothetical protein